MLLTSPSFESGAAIPVKFTCRGGDINPELQIQNVPADARSLALIVYGSDAPLEAAFANWLVWNINPATTLIKEESVPPGANEGQNGDGTIGYKGPCATPTRGVSHYRFKLYALDALLELPENIKAVDLEKEIQKHLIESAELVGLDAW